MARRVEGLEGTVECRVEILAARAVCARSWRETRPHGEVLHLEGLITAFRSSGPVERTKETGRGVIARLVAKAGERSTLALLVGWNVPLILSPMSEIDARIDRSDQAWTGNLAGLANSSGQVGRNFMAHVATQVWGTFADETRPNKGWPSSLITEDMGAASPDFAGRYLVQSLGVVPVTWATQVTRGRGLWGQPLVDYLQRYNHVAGIGINGDCLPQDGNRLTLSNEADATGVPKPLIEYSYGANERAMSAHAAGFLSDIWTAAGGTDLWTFERAAHTIGTCRMGKDAGQLVVNGTGRSFDIGNLWICDNSVFPSAVAANPALTIMALSLRTADAFLSPG